MLLPVLALTLLPLPGVQGDADHGSGVIVGSPAVSHRDLRALLGVADLVFEGVAVDVQTQLSEPAKEGQRPIPYTLVTYRVEHLLAGPDPGPHATLRLIGGPHPATGLVLRASGVPHIDVGERDILFVQGNTDAICPLVGQNSGRLRVVDGQVYTDLGRSVQLAPDSRLLTGRRFRLEVVQTSMIGDVEQVFAAPSDAIVGPSDAVLAADLRTAIRALAPTAANPDASFVSAVPGAPFRGPDFSEAAPPKSVAPPVTLTARERLERELNAAEDAAARAAIVRKK